MRKFLGWVLRALFDLRIVVGLGGIVTSIVMHELFHILVHWGEVREINIFPDPYAIVEVIVAPSREYDLMFEEALAYTITMVVLILTAMAISEVNDLRDKKSVQQTILTKSFGDHYPVESESQMLEHLGVILGVKQAKP